MEDQSNLGSLDIVVFVFFVFVFVAFRERWLIIASREQRAERGSIMLHCLFAWRIFGVIMSDPREHQRVDFDWFFSTRR